MTTMPHAAALKVEAGATYLIRSDRHLTPDEVAKIRKAFHDLTDADVVILPPSLRLVATAS